MNPVADWFPVRITRLQRAEGRAGTGIKKVSGREQENGENWILLGDSVWQPPARQFLTRRLAEQRLQGLESNNYILVTSPGFNRIHGSQLENYFKRLDCG